MILLLSGFFLGALSGAWFVLWLEVRRNRTQRYRVLNVRRWQ